MTKRTIRVKEVVRDVRAGLDDAKLIAKYNLSPEWVPILLNRLVQMGLLMQAEVDRRISEDLTEFEKTVDLGLPEKEIGPRTLLVETEGMGDPTETANISNFLGAENAPAAVGKNDEPTEEAQTSLWDPVPSETHKALNEFASWWGQSELRRLYRRQAKGEADRTVRIYPDDPRQTADIIVETFSRKNLKTLCSILDGTAV
jgi:hypothetical protein